ncbi:metal-dependent transcriptional regulator [Anseongella ginsenosidimutans]|uniref:metal-dependent transcriptional regulator n=1 Tax=Anseongella ginsenosidimutans TaxID=496056 RepID=UPI001CEF64AB|nr:metal-dependent transcriptional regulator [Anseongella ginsenosidimutans]
MNSFTEENYLKAIYKLSERTEEMVSTNAISEEMNTRAASVTDMLKKLSEKGLINYVKYQGVSLTSQGKVTAVNIIRKHRLWEVFLVNKLDFGWDEVHDIAEELEHINSEKLVDRLDEFLGCPQFDPHGDPIPTKTGKFREHDFIKLSKLERGESGVISGVSDHSSTFLHYLERLNMVLGKRISMVERNEYDGSVVVEDGEEAKYTSVRRCPIIY